MLHAWAGRWMDGSPQADSTVLYCTPASPHVSAITVTTGQSVQYATVQSSLLKQSGGRGGLT